MRRFESVRGLQRSPCLDIAFVFRRDASRRFWCPPSVHQRPQVELGCVQCVEKFDRVLASVAGEVAVVAVDRRQAGAHVAREVEGRESGTEREGREGVPEIVDPPQRLDADAFWAGRHW